MGHLCYIVNHSKKIKLDPTAKFRELLLAHWGDIVLHLINDDWKYDRLEVICQSDMERWEQYHNYEDKTKEILSLYEDSIGDKA